MRISTCLSVFAISLFAAFGLTGQTPTQGAASVQSAPAFSESTPYVPRAAATGTNSNIKSGRVKVPPAADIAPARVVPDQFSFAVSVLSAKGDPVRDISRSDIQVFVGDVEQTVLSVEAERPLNVVLLIDVSPSTGDAAGAMQKLASEIVDALRPDDKVMVVQFADSLTVLTDFTSDRKVIARALSKTKMEDGTGIYDAVADLFQKHLVPLGQPPSVILFSDGIDTVSMRASYASSLVDAEIGNAVVIPVFFESPAEPANGVKNKSVNNTRIFGRIISQGAPSTTKEEKALGIYYLNDLINLSGGRGMPYVKEDPTAGKPGAKIADWLKTQYIVNIKPLPAGPDRPAHRLPLRVRVNRPGLFVLAKSTYIQ